MPLVVERQVCAECGRWTVPVGSIDLPRTAVGLVRQDGAAVALIGRWVRRGRSSLTFIVVRMEWNRSGWSCVYPPMDEGSWAIDCLVQAVVSDVGALSFDAFYRRDRDKVAEALALTIGNGALAVEATDEAMARALARWDRIGTYDNPGGWVFRVGLNWARSRLRRRRFEHELPEGHPVEVHDPDVRADLDRALATLDVKHRSVVVLRHVLGYSSLETADALAISEGTVKSRLSRALERLRDELEDHDV